jgi:segregation and condensation protein B
MEEIAEPTPVIEAAAQEQEEPAAEEQQAAPSETPSGEVPSGEAPSGEALSDETPSDQAPSGEALSNEAPPDEALPDEAQAEELPFEPIDDVRLKAIIEAIVYLTDEPLSIAQIASALKQTPEKTAALLSELTAEFDRPEHGVCIREIAGGFSLATKPEHHEEVRTFVKNMQPPMKLSLAGLETLAVIAYKQPITAPEIMEIRGVQGAGVLKTLIERRLIAVAGRKNVVGKPILYKTTKEFLVQFGLKDLNELPSLKEFDEIRRQSVTDEPAPAAPDPQAESQPAPEPENTDGA